MGSSRHKSEHTMSYLGKFRGPTERLAVIRRLSKARARFCFFFFLLGRAPWPVCALDCRQDEWSGWPPWCGAAFARTRAAAFNSLSRARSKFRVGGWGWEPEGPESEEELRFFCWLLNLNKQRAWGVRGWGGWAHARVFAPLIDWRQRAVCCCPLVCGHGRASHRTWLLLVPSGGPLIGEFFSTVASNSLTGVVTVPPRWKKR
jgi:hypothetical protein